MRLRAIPAVTAIAAETFLGAAASPAQAGTGLLISVHINKQRGLVLQPRTTAADLPCGDRI